MLYERVSFTHPCPIPIVQMHYARYVWALRYCAGVEVLDAGCGVGYGSNLIGMVAGGIVGVDISEDAIMEARARFSHPTFVCCPLESYREQDFGRAFDTIVAFEFLEHVEDMSLVLGELRLLLREGGKLLLSLPLYQGHNPYHHGRHYGVDEWRAVVVPHFQVRTFWHQPIESLDGGNVCVTPLRPTAHPKDGIMLAECY
mgnify:FL=1